MQTLQIETAEVFEPLLEPARYKGAWGGRGSGKSHFFAGLLIEDCLAAPGDNNGEGMRAVCIREVQKDLAQSSKLLLESKLQQLGLGEAEGFKVFRDVIRVPGDGIIIFKGMNDYTADSIKSLEGFLRAWWEEAQTATGHSLNLLRPTMRAPGSQLWFGWNPRRKTDPVDVMLRGAELPTGARIVRANWRDNPWLTDELKQERLDCLRQQPDQYEHIWEGGYVSVIEGAYYAKSLNAARAEHRIGRVAPDPLMTYRLFFDIGGTGARADAVAIWVAQFLGREIRALDYYEAVGQPLATHLNWMRERGYTTKNAQVWLPHDGDTHDKVYDVSYQSAIKAAGYDVTVVPNQGKGAAKARIESGRRWFPSVTFNEETCRGGLDALGWYHEKKDEQRSIGLGPEHDWSSHGCFLGETKVWTRYGLRQIMNLPKTGEVLTPCGWKRYVHPRITKRNAQLVEVVFTSGYSVRCTPDHLFLTVNGWKSAESLMPNTEILSTLTRSRSISTAVSIACGQAIAICREAGRSFTAMLGQQRSGQFQKTATSITVMETFSTIVLRIWNAWTQASIVPCHGEQDRRQLTVNTLVPALETKPPSGIDLPRADCGTRVTLSVHEAGPSGSAKKNLVLTAAKHIWHSFEKAATLVSTVLIPAKQPLIERVKHLNETSDVWDLTVPDGHCFSLENGAVVHNSDAFGLMCIAAEEIFAESNRIPVDPYRAFRRG